MVVGGGITQSAVALLATTRVCNDYKNTHTLARHVRAPGVGRWTAHACGCVCARACGLPWPTWVRADGRRKSHLVVLIATNSRILCFFIHCAPWLFPFTPYVIRRLTATAAAACACARKRGESSGGLRDRWERRWQRSVWRKSLASAGAACCHLNKSTCGPFFLLLQLLPPFRRRSSGSRVG